MYELVGPDDWVRSSLFDLATWKNGLAFKNIQFSDSGDPVIKIAELKSGITEQTKFTRGEYGDEVRVEPGDMLFSWSGNPDTSIDVFEWDGPPGWLNQHIYKVTPAEGVDRDFLFFLLKWLKPRFAEIARNKQTTGLGHVTLADFKQIQIGLPKPDEQAAIVALVKPYHDKITLNRRMNATLEAMARAIFRDWFVDFGPTRAKMEGRPPYLAPDLWPLFPARLDDQGIPEGWQMGTLGDLIKFNPSEPLKKGTPAPYLNMAALPTQGSVADDWVERDFTSGMRFRNGDALLARITPCLENGKAAYIQSLPEGSVGWGSTEFIVMRAKPPVPRPFPYLVVRHPEFRRHAIKSMSGTSGRQRTNKEALEGFPFVIPSDGIWEAFGRIVDPAFEKIRANGEESRTLAQTRDLLLPRLMSGEIRVREAEDIVESAG